MLFCHVLIHILRIRHVLGRRCVVRYVLGLRYVIRRSVKRATGTKNTINIHTIYLHQREREREREIIINPKAEYSRENMNIFTCLINSLVNHQGTMIEADAKP